MVFGKVLAAALVGAALFGAAAPAAANEPVLVLDGSVRGGEITFTRSELEALGVERIVTRTPWHDGEVTFEGVPMSRLMSVAGAEGTNAYVLALNDYSTVIPLSDFDRFGPILAIKRDGAYMPVSDKGPFFVVYPYSTNPEVNNELYYSRSAWQVKSISIE